MLDIIGGGLFGTIFGGLFRLAPEVLKFLDRKNERQHELAMFNRQCELEQIRGEVKLDNPALKALGPYQVEKVSIAAIGRNQVAAQRILDQAGYR